MSRVFCGLSVLLHARRGRAGRFGSGAGTRASALGRAQRP